MTSTACDLSLCFERIQGTLQGLIAMHVEDTLGASNDQFEKETLRKMLCRFDAKALELGSFTFSRVLIRQMMTKR